jgi:CheY-like chemotaxis protein
MPAKALQFRMTMRTHAEGQASESDRQALSEIRLPRRRRPPRIVVVDDEPGLVEISGELIRHWINDVTLLLFTESTKALEELSRHDPDLLITDDIMPCLFGREICERLLERRATCPIIVRSALSESEHWVRECARQGLNVRFLPAPHEVLTFRTIVAQTLGGEWAHPAKRNLSQKSDRHRKGNRRNDPSKWTPSAT